MPRPSLRPLVALTAALILSVALGGCGSDSSTSARPSTSASPIPASPIPASPTARPSGASGSTQATANAGTVPYVALGDSYAAAPGVPSTSLAGGCVRSDHNYPHLLAAARPELALTDVTCSGATTADLAARQHILQTSVPAQLDALRPTTRLVTLGIGGNDGGLFQAVLDHCLHGDGGCLASVDGFGDHSVLYRGLVDALDQIHRRAPRARIMLIGYPQLVPGDDHGCALLPVGKPVITAVRGLIEGLAQTMRHAASTAGATYVDLIGPSRGHDICSDSPWINGPRITDQAIAFHPLPAEQEAVAHLVGDAYASPRRPAQRQAGVSAP